MTDPFSAKQRYGDRPANDPLLRVLSFLGGVLAIPFATLLPLLFVVHELQEAKSARQWGANPIPGTVAAVVIGLTTAIAAGFISYKLFRFAFKKRKPYSLPDF